MDYAYLLNQIKTFTGSEQLFSVRLDKMAGDASERSFYRLKCNKKKSFVLMRYKPPQPSKHETLVEVWKYFYDQNLGVPELYHHHIEGGVLFFEDCGDITLEQLAHNESPERYYPYYKQAIDLLLRIQQAGSKKIDRRCPAFRLAFDAEKFCWELDFFIENMLQEKLQIKLELQDKQELQTHFLNLVKVLAAQPRYLTHRDYHSRNLMIKDNKVRIVDFQDARLGLCQYDLASLLRDSYVKLAEKEIDSLLEYYIIQKEQAENISIDRKAFRRLFDYTSIQRNLKAVGTFAYLACKCGKTKYLDYIPQTLLYVKTNLAKYPELTPLQECLSKYLPEVQ